MKKEITHQIVKFIINAQDIARKIGIPNILQPGLVKEMIIADILGHELIITKRDADAHAVGNPQIKYEYLSCKEGGSGQLDRMFKEPPSKRAESIKRITRNDKIYLAIFFSDNMLKAKAIYEIESDVMADAANILLDNSSNAISHFGFTEKWAKKHGKLIYPKQDEDIFSVAAEPLV